jgi:NAD(P)-dependent dehydrogenase (short-subunit alcohol dehydrogenase family)
MSEWTAADLPSFAGRTVIVTGANSGLGLVTARELARVGAKTILAVRNTTKGDEAAATMTGDVEVRKLDLQDLASVRAFADGVDGVDVLVNNAGIMAVPYAQTVDGFESQIGTNHLGHFALTNLLLSKITERVVTVSSVMHLLGYISIKDLNWKSRPYLAWPAYGQSKLANLLFTSELQRRLDAAGSPLKALVAHPGYSATNLQGHTGNRMGTRCGTQATGSSPQPPTSAPARPSTRCPKICRATPSSVPASPCAAPPDPPRSAARWRATPRRRPRSGSYPSSSQTPNSRSELLMR